MKKIKYSLFGMMFAALALSGCQSSYDAPGLDHPEATMVPNTKIADIKKIIYDALDPAEPTEDVRFRLGLKDEALNEHYIIKGRVISSDASGNMYQNLVLQDETAALTLAIREASMWTRYRVGQEVVVDLTDLYIGTNAALYEVGWLSDYIGEESLSFMSWFMFQDHSQLNGMPYSGDFQDVTMTDEWPSDAPYCIVTTIPEIRALNQYSVEGYKAMSQLVEIQDVHFVDPEGKTFADYQTSNDYRMIADDFGNTLPLNNSGYSNFYNEPLPEGKGNIRAILTYYNFSDFQDTKWQLVLRGMEDVLFDIPGTQEHPFTVTEALEQDNSGRLAWTNGYIVGCVKAGVSSVQSADDVLFGQAATEETNNNVLIAESKDETDWTKCMLVELPVDTYIRDMVNLLDNPGNLGKLLNVQGLLNEYLGMHGIMGCTGSNFAIEGAYPPGTENNPFDVNYVINNPEPQSDIWVEGYIVGFVIGQEYETGANFRNYALGDNYSGANIIISSKPVGEATPENSIPVNCSSKRMELGLNYQPDNYGKKVSIKGNINAVYNATGIDNVTDARVE